MGLQPVKTNIIMTFNELLLRTAFSCMACDGQIAPEEVQLIRDMATNHPLISHLDVNAVLNNLIREINKRGVGFLKLYFIDLHDCGLSAEQEIQVLQVAVDMIRADERVEYHEIRFFKILRSHLTLVSDERILKDVKNIDETFLARDIRTDYHSLFCSYFSQISIPKFEIDL